VKRYALSSEAQQDLQEIRAYYLKAANAPVARRVLGEITDAFVFLAANPGVGHSCADLTGEPLKFWQVFSYLIVYDHRTHPIGVARVLHTSRDVAAILGRPLS
jgi:plasmid stabilization system protein ParE